MNRQKPIGQASVEYLLMLGIFVFIGLLLMNVMIGPQGDSGASSTVGPAAARKIVNDPD